VPDEPFAGIDGRALLDGSVPLAKLNLTGELFLVPIGCGVFCFTTLAIAQGFAPTALICDGSLVSATTYGTLQARTGATISGGLFALPDMRGLAAVGLNPAPISNRRTMPSLGAVVGADTDTLSVGSIPAHSHTLDGYQATVVRAPFTGTGTGAGWLMENPQLGQTTGSYGGAGAHNNMQPSLVGLWLVRAS
jgi:microcystin-dependent protein